MLEMLAWYASLGIQICSPASLVGEGHESVPLATFFPSKIMGITITLFQKLCMKGSDEGVQRPNKEIALEKTVRMKVALWIECMRVVTAHERMWWKPAVRNRNTETNRWFLFWHKFQQISKNTAIWWNQMWKPISQWKSWEIVCKKNLQKPQFHWLCYIDAKKLIFAVFVHSKRTLMQWL